VTYRSTPSGSGGLRLEGNAARPCNTARTRPPAALRTRARYWASATCGHREGQASRLSRISLRDTRTTFSPRSPATGSTGTAILGLWRLSTFSAGRIRDEDSAARAGGRRESRRGTTSRGHAVSDSHRRSSRSSSGSDVPIEGRPGPGSLVRDTGSLPGRAAWALSLRSCRRRRVGFAGGTQRSPEADVLQLSTGG